MLYRFDPRTPHQAGDTHPSSTSRIRSSLDVLERIDQNAGPLSPYAEVRSVLADTWDEMVASACRDVLPEPAEAEDPNLALREQLWLMLEDAIPLARYKDWLSAQQIAHTLLGMHRDGAELEADVDDLRTVLNATWAARLIGPADMTPALGQWSLAACERLVHADAGNGGGT